MKLSSIANGIIILGLTFSAQSIAADYKLDISGQHAFVSFKVGHLGYSYIAGRFNKFDGEFSHDAKNPSASKVKVVIQTNSLDSNHAERDKHLRGAKFLNASKYPKITFESTSFSASGKGGNLKGNLTIHGVTKPVVIAVLHIGEGKDPWGGYRSGFAGNVTINSADFGLPGWVGDVEIELNIEGVKQ